MHQYSVGYTVIITKVNLSKKLSCPKPVFSTQFNDESGGFCSPLELLFHFVFFFLCIMLSVLLKTINTTFPLPPDEI